MSIVCYECDCVIMSGKVSRLSGMGNTIWLCSYCDRITPPYAGEWRR